LGAGKASKKAFNADQQQMHAKHANGPERIAAVCLSPDYRRGVWRRPRDDNHGRFIQSVCICVFCVHLLLICVKNLLLIDLLLAD
jgi:hypothetical protein